MCQALERRHAGLGLHGLDIAIVLGEQDDARQIIADDTCDGEMCATDLLGQAEHGTNSPAVLLTNSQTIVDDTLAEIDKQLQTLATADVAGQAWRDYGQIILCDTYEEMLEEADRIASEHVQVMTKDPDYFLDNMTNYGALFLGQEHLEKLFLVF